MIACPACQNENVDNTLFCNECGASLLEDDSPVTDAMGHVIGNVVDFANGTDGHEKMQQGSGPLAVGLKIGNAEQQVEFSLEKPIHMGRLDPGSNIYPEVDLTTYGGVEQGVSRRHARIMRRQGSIFVEDLGSSNGTFVNGQKLNPYFPEALANGDYLRLGGLRIEIHTGP